MERITKIEELIGIIGAAAILIVLSVAAISYASAKTVIVDDAKRRIEIPERPKKIIVLNSSNLELLYAVGGEAVGRPESTGMPKELYEKVKSLPSVGETPNPNIEKIVALDPDLVIGVNISFHHAIIPPLEKAKIPVIFLSINNYKDIMDKLKIYGRITGNHKRAMSIISDIQKKTEEIRKAVQGYRKKKVAIIWGSTQSFNMALPASFVGNLVEMLGGINIAAGSNPITSMPQYAPLSMEYILSKDPDVVLLITHGYDDKVSDKFKKEIERHPAWKGLRAVKDGRVYQLPYPLFGVNPAIRVADAIEHLAELLYPEIKKGSGAVLQ